MRTTHSPAGSACLRVAPRHRGDRRWERACRSHGHRSRQAPAVFVGGAGAKDQHLTMEWRAASAEITAVGLANGRATRFFDFAPLEPVSAGYRTSLRCLETEIEKRRAETGAAQSPIQATCSANCRAETRAAAPNPPECRRFSHSRKSQRRDDTGWLGRQDSNLGIRRRS